MRSCVALALLIVSLFLLACSKQESCPLFEVEGVGPADLELGEVLVVRGKGFPSARPPHVHLRGTVERLGQGVGSIDLVVPSRVTSSSTLELVIGTEVGKSFFGETTTEHVAFSGSLEVGFSAFRSDEEPIVATIHGITFDLNRVADPGGAADLHERGLREAERFGLAVEEHVRDDDREIVVASVAPRSPADRAEVRVGDTVLRRGTIRVRDVSDLVGASSDRFLVIAHQGKDVRIEAPMTRLPSPVHLWLLGLLAALFLAFSVPPKFFHWIETARLAKPSPDVAAALVVAAIATARGLGALSRVDLVAVFALLLVPIAWIRVPSRAFPSLAFEALTVGATLALVSHGAASFRVEDVVAAQAQHGSLVLQSPLGVMSLGLFVLSVGRNTASVSPLVEGVLVTASALLFIGVPHPGWIGALELVGVAIALLFARSMVPMKATFFSTAASLMVTSSLLVVHSNMRGLTISIAVLALTYATALVIRAVVRRAFIPAVRNQATPLT